MIFCCAQARTQCLNSLLSSKVSASICRVEVGLVSLFWVLPSKRVLLPSIIISSFCNCLVVLHTVCGLPRACYAPFHECIRYARSPICFVRPALSPSSCHLSHEKFFQSNLCLLLERHFELLRDCFTIQ